MTRWVKAHIRLGIRSVSPSDQSPLHEGTLGPYLSIGKFRGISPRKFAEFLRKLLRSLSTKFRRESPWRNKSFLFFSAKKKNLFRARGVLWQNAKKELFSWADLFVQEFFRVSQGLIIRPPNGK